MMMSVTPDKSSRPVLNLILSVSVSGSDIESVNMGISSGQREYTFAPIKFIASLAFSTFVTAV